MKAPGLPGISVSVRKMAPALLLPPQHALCLPGRCKISPREHLVVLAKKREKKNPATVLLKLAHSKALWEFREASSFCPSFHAMLRSALMIGSSDSSCKQVVFFVFFGKCVINRISPSPPSLCIACCWMII